MNINKGYIKYISEGKDFELDIKIGEIIKDSNITITFEKSPDRLVMLINPTDEIEIKELYLQTDIEINKEDRIFLNGFQSWTDTKEFETDEKIPPLNRLMYKKLNGYGDYSFYKYKNKKGISHGWSYSYIRKTSDKIIFYGSLNEETGYTLLEYDTNTGKLKIIKECEKLIINEKYMAFDLFIKEGEENTVLNNYFGCMKIKKPQAELITGWTSWYNYYTDIDEKIIVENLEAFSEKNIPIDIFQIDDGYQQAVGDWLITNDKFRKGMKFIADKIKSTGYKAGLWLAPFICEKKSDIFNMHPDWLLKDDKGKPVIAGYGALWSGNFFALDIYNKDLREYLKTVFNTVLRDWGFDMVKLDFLYATAILPREGKTRGQIMREAMEFLREITGDDKYILGCGVPLAPAYGLVEYCRVGADVGLQWKDDIMKHAKCRERVSTVNTLKNTIHRRHIDGQGFYNDPDVFTLRSANMKFSDDEKYTIFLTNLIFGSLVFTSDDVKSYTDEQMHRYLSLFPMKSKDIKEVKQYAHGVYKTIFNIDDRSYTALINLSDNEEKMTLDTGKYFYAENGEIVSDDFVCVLKPHTSVCLYNIDTNKTPELLGGRGHIFSGCEVRSVKQKLLSKDIVLEYEDKSINRDELYIKIADGVKKIKINGKDVSAEEINGLNIVRYKP